MKNEPLTRDKIITVNETNSSIPLYFDVEDVASAVALLKKKYKELALLNCERPIHKTKQIGHDTKTKIIHCGCCASCKNCYNSLLEDLEECFPAFVERDESTIKKIEQGLKDVTEGRTKPFKKTTVKKESEEEK